MSDKLSLGIEIVLIKARYSLDEYMTLFPAYNEAALKMENNIDDQRIYEIGEPTDIAGVHIVEGRQPGPSVGLMGMLHGNEHAGLGLWDLIDQLGRPARGRLYMIVGHPEAYQHPGQSVRSLRYDINRLFSDDLTSNASARSADHARCFVLQKLLAKLDVLIDIHSTSSCTEPFVVVPESTCEHLHLASELPITQLFRLDRYLNKTATSWLTRQGRTGIMIEVGQHQNPASRSIAADVTYRILKKLGMIGLEPTIEQKEVHYQQRYIGILRQTRVEGFDFKYLRQCRNFQGLKPGEVIARDAVRDYVAPDLDNLVLCMPTAAELLRDNIGSEAFYLGVDCSFVRSVLEERTG